MTHRSSISATRLRRTVSQLTLASLVLLWSVTPRPGLAAPAHHIEPLAARPAMINEIMRERLDSLLPRLMRETGIHAWLVIAREYNDDPVYRSLAPEPSFTARRTTMLLFVDRGPDHGVDRLTISRYPLGDLYTAAWQGGELQQQWARLAEVVRSYDPKNIAINVSRDWPVADGLSHSLHQQLIAALKPELAKRLVPAEPLVIRWLETRLPAEIQGWRHAVAAARATIAEAFSSTVITPGVTTVGEVAWFIRRRFADLHVNAWFHPDVNVQREGQIVDESAAFFGDDAIDLVIQPGDVLHTDVGFCYLRLCTDTQEMGYVLRDGELVAPAGLQRALATGNRWQDLLTRSFETGASGNAILRRTLAAAQAEGMVAAVYTHPLGVFGHAPGPTIGMWDNQGNTPVQGEWPLRPMTGYAIEGNVKVRVPELGGRLVQIKLEQSALYTEESVEYLAGRQTQWHLVH